MNAPESEDKFGKLVEHSLTGVFVQQDGRYVYANDSFLEIHGYTRDELIAKPFSDLVAPEDRRKVEQMVADRIAGKAVPRRYEIRRLKKSGESVWCEMMVDRIEYRGKPAVTGNVIDISERKRLEQQLRDTNTRLSDALAELRAIQRQVIQSERLSALGQMASGIAHDFNNALMPILGFTELLLGNPALLDNKTESTTIIKDVHSAAKDAAETIKRLREFYRTADDMSDYALVDIGRLVDAVEARVRPKWEDAANGRGITVEFRKEVQGAPSVMGNESQLCEALTNLTLNATEALPKGGVITIRSRTEGTWVVVEIADTGVGMTEEALHRWMEPFFSTKKSGAGLGIGLSVTYGIVRRHGGTIAVRSEPDKGATFSIRLPGEASRADREDRVKTAPEASPPLRVLVVDDDVWSRRLIERYLLEDNHVAEAVSTGREGVEKFKGGNFDLVITDWAISDMTGDEVARSVKESNRHTPVILLTGFGDLVRDTGETRSGVDVILGKPLTIKELRDAIKKVTQVSSSARTAGAP